MDFVQLVISACHANAKHPKSRPTEAPRSHLYHPQFPRVRGKPPSDSPATAHDGGAIIWPGGNSVFPGCGELDGVFGGFAVFWSGTSLDASLSSA